MNPLVRARGQGAPGNHRAGDKFLRVIDGEVSPELEGKVSMQQTGDPAHSRFTVPYGRSDNGSKEAALIQIGMPRLF